MLVIMLLSLAAVCFVAVFCGFCAVMSFCCGHIIVGCINASLFIFNVYNVFYTWKLIKAYVLKRCPMCGGKGKYTENRIKCTSCGFMTTMRTNEQEAKDEWNGVHKQ